MSSPVQFSIVVPTYARPERLQACLAALAGLTFPGHEREILVVDDGSPEVPESVRAASGALGARLVVQPHAGPAAARNTGAAEARGRFLVFTDDDCAPDPGWLAALAARLRGQPDRMVGGRTINRLPENRFAAASQDLVESLYAHYNARPDQARFFTSNNMAVSAQRFQQIGGFDTHFPAAAGEDREFCDRWLSAGLEMCYAPDAVVRHAHPLTWRSFWRQHVNYGRGAVRVYRLRALRGPAWRRLETTGFYWQLLISPFRRARLRRPGGLQIALLTVISQAAAATGYAWEMLLGRNEAAKPPRR